MELKDVFEPLVHFLKNFQKKEKDSVSKDKAKERLQLVLMQDRASVSPDFFEMMKKEIIEVIKKYIEIDEEQLEVQLTRGFENGDETGPALYANIPIKNIKPVAKKTENPEKTENTNVEEIEAEIKNVAEKHIAQENNNSSKHDKKHNKKEESFDNTNVDTQNLQNETTEKLEDDAVQAENDKNENVDSVEENVNILTEDATEEVLEEAPYTINTNAEEIIPDSKKDMNELKAKFNNMKDGAIETFSKVKSQAKDGIEKIKSKVKAKN